MQIQDFNGRKSILFVDQVILYARVESEPLVYLPKKMETEKLPEAADSPLYIYLYVQFSQDYNCSTDPWSMER